MQKNQRAFIERRTGKDRRRRFSIKGRFFRKHDRRRSQERRSNTEHRKNWVRVSKWSSAPPEKLENLQIPAQVTSTDRQPFIPVLAIPGSYRPHDSQTI